ncbi:hypothetical protein [Mycolicibacterium phage J1]|nr:hypothetical protein [Mycolicibacterium phage J1]
MSKKPKEKYDCENCEFACKYDGLCDYDMFPGYKEGDPLYCEILLKEN